MCVWCIYLPQVLSARSVKSNWLIENEKEKTHSNELFVITAQFENRYIQLKESHRSDRDGRELNSKRFDDRRTNA